MELTHNGKFFILRCSFEDREVAKSAGFRWDFDNKFWLTENIAVAARLGEFADERTRRYLSHFTICHHPFTGPLRLPPKTTGLELLPHQLEAVRFALSRNRSYLGLDPGLGKTPTAAVVINTLQMKAVYILPPFLLENVKSEFSRWAGRLKLSVFGSVKEFSFVDDMLLLPDSLLRREECYRTVKSFLGGKPGVLVVDEAHRFKSQDAIRTQALFGGKSKRSLRSLFEREVYMSGTPMPNRPMELFPILSKVAPETIDFMNMFQYGRKFCAGKKTDFGWDFSGASNMQELNQRVKYPSGPFMLRMRKDLLKLPPLIEEIFVVSGDQSPRLTEMGRKLGDAYRDTEDLTKHALAQKAGVEGDLHVATYRRLLGKEKVEPAGEYVKAVLDEYPSEKILVFAYHKEVIAALIDILSVYKPYVITGETTSEERHALVNKFQNDRTPRVLIANYATMIGFNITAATRAVFVEFDWTPGVNQQAMDRAHRIGQTKSVLVQYVVYKDSLDKLVIETLLRKRKSIEHI